MPESPGQTLKTQDCNAKNAYNEIANKKRPPDKRSDPSLQTRFTPALEAKIRELRGEGKEWVEISAIMGIDKTTLAEKGRRMGLGGYLARRVRVEIEFAKRTGNCALEAGHPATWGVISDQPWPGASIR